MNLKLLALGVAGLATIGLTACGGGGGGKAVDAEDWVDDLCKLAGDFEEDSQDSFGEFLEVDLTDRDAKDDVIDIFEDVKNLMDDTLDEYEKLGYPDLDDGKKIRDLIGDDLKQSRDDLDGLIKELKKIDEDDFENDFESVAADFEEDEFDLESELEDVGRDGDEIIDLINEDPDCATTLFE